MDKEATQKDFTIHNGGGGASDDNFSIFFDPNATKNVTTHMNKQNFLNQTASVTVSKENLAKYPKVDDDSVFIYQSQLAEPTKQKESSKIPKLENRKPFSMVMKEDEKQEDLKDSSDGDEEVPIESQFAGLNEQVNVE